MIGSVGGFFMSQFCERCAHRCSRSPLQISNAWKGVCSSRVHMTFRHLLVKQPILAAPSPTERGLTHFSSLHRPSARRHLKRTVSTHITNAAASWSGFPEKDACEVASTLNDDGQNAVTARVRIQASVLQVWQVLTNFEKLLDVVPYLIACEEVPSPNPETKRLRQSAGIQCSWWKLWAQALLEIRFQELSSGQRKELHFNMIEGDFKVCSLCMSTYKRGMRITAYRNTGGDFLLKQIPVGSRLFWCLMR